VLFFGLRWCFWCFLWLGFDLIDGRACCLWGVGFLVGVVFNGGWFRAGGVWVGVGFFVGNVCWGCRFELFVCGWCSVDEWVVGVCVLHPLCLVCLLMY